MDVEAQILKHLPRDARSSVSFIDEYCSSYKDLFPEVRSYECFKYLHLGIISSISRKSLPEIAKVVGVNSPQVLHHFIAKSPWSAAQLRNRRLAKILEILQGKAITVIIDETGDRKKGNKTDYVARQYLGSVGKVDRGIVSVNAYGVYQNMTFPLDWKIFKPRGTLAEDDCYQTKIELAREIISELVKLGFNIKLVLADSLYGESSSFIEVLEKHNLSYIVSIRSNHGVWLPATAKVRANKWHQFPRTFSDGTTEIRYSREIIYGQRRSITYWEITTDPETLPENSTSFVMTNIQGKIQKTVGNFYGGRTWVEYGFRQVKQELGWTDYRFTKFEQVEKWWELIFSAYLMVSLSSQALLSLTQPPPAQSQRKALVNKFANHHQWNHTNGWKNCLNNLRLIIQPIILLWSILPWLQVFPNRDLLLGFHQLIAVINQFSFGLNTE
jgi:SRSO17 transposase